MQLTNEPEQARRAGRVAALTALVGAPLLAGLGLVAAFGGETLGAVWDYQDVSAQALLIVGGGGALIATCLALATLVPRRPLALLPVLVVLSCPPWLAGLTAASAKADRLDGARELGVAPIVLASQLAETLFLGLMGKGLALALLAAAGLGLLVSRAPRPPGAAMAPRPGRTGAFFWTVTVALAALSYPGLQQFSLLKDAVLAGGDLGPGLLTDAGSFTGLSRALGWGGLALSLAVGIWAMKGRALAARLAGGVVVAAALGGTLSWQARLDTRVEVALSEILDAPAPVPEPSGDAPPAQAEEGPH